MSLEEFLLMFGGCGLAILLLRMVLTGRFLAAGTALLFFAVASLPFLPERWDALSVAVVELITASLFAAVALLYVRRPLAMVAFVAAALAYAAPHFMQASLRATLPPLVLLALYVPMIALLSPPLFIALSSIYCLDAFIEHRSH
jgi:hypothetical protein